MKGFTILLLSVLLVSRFGNLTTAEAQSRPGHRPHDRSDWPALAGQVLSPDSTAVGFATVYLQDTPYADSADAEGFFRLKVPAGSYTLVVTAVGFEPYRQNIRIDATAQRGARQNIVLRPRATVLEEVTVVASAVSRVRESPFNAVALGTEAFRNTTRNLGEALAHLPGMKLRETGGVGSDMQLMLDGFSGKHVKVFIDGVPQEGAGTALDLNNLPVGFADRIEVYKGVVPVEFGSDAIGGVINIVTNRRRRDWFLDASYSYGSFHTHRSQIDFGRTSRSGFLFEMNAFQNYSDNDYHIHNWVREFEVLPDGSIHKFPVDKDDVRRVRRFNDRFHNEVVTGKIGVVGKKWADRLLFGFTGSNFYKEIQTGVYQEIVFGKKHREGTAFAPSVEYGKHNLLVEGLDLALTANYNHNVTRNIDTAARSYNWLGAYYVTESRGEQSYQNSESKNTNWNAALRLNYRTGRHHAFTFNHIVSDFRRTSRSHIGTSSALTDFTIPKITRKNISGLSYRLSPSERWNATLFVKYYRQYNEGPVSQSTDGIGNYVRMDRTVGTWGYGTAGTYHILRALQAKLSYEHACRLPTTDELFGDEDLEAGRTELRPERSDNYNFNLSYDLPLGKHRLYAEFSFIYRDTKDYIKRGLDQHGSTQFGIYENHGHVKTVGYSLSLRYAFGRLFDFGGTFSDIDTRDYEKTWTGASQQQSMHYRVRLPNIPYRFAGFNANFRRDKLFARDDTLTLSYDGFWQHAFPLNWENIGDKDSKAYVPDQLSHNIALTYSMRNGRYNLCVECRNLTDARLYDNFSLQKAGRAFYAKLRVHFGDR